MEVKVNVINEMKRLRENTYSDKYTWIDELVQNCQRAKATHIDVQISDDRIVISDNGIGCSDPQILFDKSSSGWDEDTTRTESPFGEGFFSTMMAADTITATSIGFSATFDVKKMFAENRTDVIEIQSNRRKSGFTIVLTDLCENVYSWEVERRFREVGKYIKSPTMTVNGDRVHYEGLNPKTDSPFVRKIDTPFFKGWIEPRNWRNGNYGDNSIKCFAYNRHIKDSKEFYNVAGCLNFKDNAVTLRRPDRKDFIFDDKYDAMVNCLRQEIKKMYLRIAKEGSDKDIYTFESDIERYLSLEDYRNHIKFKFLTTQTVPMAADSTNTDSDTNNDPNANELESTAENDDYYEGDVDSSPINEIESAPISTKGNFSVTTTTSPSVNVAAKIVSRRKSISNQTGQELTSDLKYAFYVKESEKALYETNIALAQHYNIPVIEIRNELEQKIVDNDDRFNHIKEMQSLVTLSAVFENMSPCNMQEVRANQIFSRIARACDAPDDLFTIGDTQFSKLLKVNDSEYTIENIDTFATAYQGKIYINRNHLRAYKNLAYGSGDKLNPDDIKFILLNLETIAHEMSHALYNNEDETLPHVTRINQLMQKIINLIYGIKATAFCV